VQYLPQSIQKLIAELAKLPSIGNRSAERLAYYLINNPSLSLELAKSMHLAGEQVQHCKTCYFFSEQPQCPICSSEQRDSSLICIVEKPADLIAIEQAGIFKGKYHVLHGLWSPLKGQGTEEMKLDQLIKRAKAENTEEVIIATGATVEGEATALYIGQFLGEHQIKASRLAQGLPKGGDLEYLDDVTLSNALSGRTKI
jgi:recombination protein RecR